MSASRYKLFCTGSGDGEVVIQMRTYLGSKIESTVVMPGFEVKLIRGTQSSVGSHVICARREPGDPSQLLELAGVGTSP